MIRAAKTVPRNARPVAVGAAMQAARVVMDFYGKAVQTDQKDPHDYVTEADRRSEEIIIQALRRAFPHHGILAEESGTQTAAGAYRWIIDPLDGTTNFIHGVPLFAISIALEVEGELAVGVVYEPLRKELFVAERGKGATINDRRMRVSTTSEPAAGLLATGFPFRNYNLVDDYLKIFHRYMTAVSGIRRAGSAALDLCYLACGRFDGFWELNLSPWDIAAGALMIEEAGGTITSFTGTKDYLTHGNIVGSNGLLHEWMLETAREAAPQSRLMQSF